MDQKAGGLQVPDDSRPAHYEGHVSVCAPTAYLFFQTVFFPSESKVSTYRKLYINIQLQIKKFEQLFPQNISERKIFPGR